MDLTISQRARKLGGQLEEFMSEEVLPAEKGAASESQSEYSKVMEQLKISAKNRGLWNLFHSDPDWGAGLSNLEYAPLAEIMGRSMLASEACNCSAPDTGNMELLTLFGTPAQKDRWLRRLLDGKIRSSFAMTEPAVASSDATNVSLTISADGDEWVLNGRKWWITGAEHPLCALFIVMGKTEPEAPVRRQQSMVLVPTGTPGIQIVRRLPLMGYWDPETHCEIAFDNVRVPKSAMLGGEGEGFMMAQARLGPGRIHHCMRSIGAAERALELLCRRALDRVTFGSAVASRANVQDWIADARVNIEMLRLLALRTAWLMDASGNKAAATEIAAIKIAGPNIAGEIIDRAIQVYGAAGMSDDSPLARLYVLQRSLRFADGPDEVHRRSLALRELRRYEPEFR
jgi:acyl-CoA dehydrogenase